MQEGFIDVNNVPTKVITWGKWVEDKFEEKEPKELIICIPGNPGVTTFYTVFLQTIYEKTEIPIWVISHAGHEISNCKATGMPPQKGNERLYNLQGQIDHKVEFFKKYVPTNTKIYLIGHSVGSYIILKLLKNELIKKKITKNYLLFPTIEYMGTTPNGKFLYFMSPLLKLTLFLSLIFTMLPLFIQNFLLLIYMKISSTPKMHLKTIRLFVNPFVLSNVYLMGKEELDGVNERDNATIAANKNILKFYYGTTDGWVPTSYYENLKRDHPDLDAELCTYGFDHAFVLRQSRHVGNMVAGWIKS